MITPRQLPKLKPGSWVALDTETSGLYPDDGATVATVSLAWWAEDMRGDACFTWGDGDADGICAVAFPFDQGPQNKPDWNGQASLFEQDDPNLGVNEWLDLITWLRVYGLNLVMHNAQFDILMMITGVRPELWSPSRTPLGVDLSTQVHWDTQLGMRAIFPWLPTSLKPACEILFGDTSDEQKALQKWLGPQTDPRFDKVPWEIIEPYAVQDAVKTLKLQRRQFEELGAGVGVQTWIEDDLETAKILVKIEQRGLPYVAEESLRVAKQVDRVLGELGQGIPFAKTDPAARKYFGVSSLTADVLADMVALQGDDSVEGRWQKYKKLQTANKMWYRGYAEKVGPDGRLRTRFRQLGTKTGRMSCERVNLQATPADFRLEGLEELHGLPTPRQLTYRAVPEGWVLAMMDLAQAELRVAVGVVANRKMAEQIAQDRDAHGETAKALFGVRKGEPRWDFLRQLAKRCNFSLINGVGWATFRQTIHKETGEWLGEHETKAIVQKWNRLYPQHKDEIYAAMERAEQDKYVPLANGRRRTFAAYEDYYKAHGNSVQGSIGFLTIDWLRACEKICQYWDIDKRGYEDGIGGAGVVSSVHDSIYLLLPETDADQIAAQCQTAGLGLWDEYFRPENNGNWSRIYVPGKIDLKTEKAK